MVVFEQGLDELPNVKYQLLYSSRETRFRFSPLQELLWFYLHIQSQPSRRLLCHSQ